MLREAAERDPTFPPVLYVHPASAEKGAAFFAQVDPQARAVADPEHKLYQAFGLGRFSIGRIFGWESLAAGLKASRKGFTVGVPAGDVRLESGSFLILDDRILWEHRPRHPGDHPDWSRIPFTIAKN